MLRGKRTLSYPGRPNKKTTTIGCNGHSTDYDSDDHPLISRSHLQMSSAPLAGAELIGTNDLGQRALLIAQEHDDWTFFWLDHQLPGMARIERPGLTLAQRKSPLYFPVVIVFAEEDKAGKCCRAITYGGTSGFNNKSVPKGAGNDKANRTDHGGNDLLPSDIIRSNRVI